MSLKQSQWTKRIVELLELQDANLKGTLVVKPLLNKNIDGKDRNKDSFHCRSVISSLSCSTRCTWPDTSIAVYQVAKFASNLKVFSWHSS